jgi:hypothetical protein
MRRRGLSEQIRVNDLAFERNTQTFERVMISLDRNEERLGQLEQVVEENKMFIRNMTRRTEKIVQDLVQRNEEFNAEQKYRVDLAAERLKQLKDESEEHRKAVLALLDRLPPPRNG